MVDMAKNINDQVLRVKQKKDTEHKKTTNLGNYLPTFILGPLSTVGSYLG